MQSSKTEKRYFVRVMIVGKESAGKTCLLRRLLKEDITDVSSTDGVDIVVRRCKINIEDGTWTIGKGIIDDKMTRIKRALFPNAEDRDTLSMQEDETNNMNIRQGDAKSTNDKNITTDTKLRQEEKEETIGSSSLAMPEESTNKALVNLDNEEITNESLSLVTPEDFTSDNNVNLDNTKKKNESSSLVMPKDVMSHVFSKSTVNAPLNLYALCELWDFAGQKEFYATHQAFLTSSAVYLVVADMKDDISKQGLGQCFADFQNIGEYVDFWFDSIHCHRTADKRARNVHFDPPILLVFTGKDKYNKEADLKKRKKELNDQLDQVLGYQSKYHHLHKKWYLSNLTDTDEEFVKLQHAIFESARKMDNWGNDFPLKWILLEHLIEINKDDGKNIINLNDMFKLAKHHDINILEKDELLLFLRLQHILGNIIFFENIPDLIILKPQWLADAFRCLVSDRIDDSSLHHLEDWTLFTRQGKISESLITELFESKDGSQFSGQKKQFT
ncbi:probable serine/threonine-protein kinase roco6 [Mytilus trossulus]|uniref:probable serine/threonine-protein kinase roco6 n=1 Tax=Mytilus trossulus TaxID=6551 RepID=UPI00300447B6